VALEWPLITRQCDPQTGSERGPEGERAGKWRPAWLQLRRLNWRTLGLGTSECVQLVPNRQSPALTGSVSSSSISDVLTPLLRRMYQNDTCALSRLACTRRPTFDNDARKLRRSGSDRIAINGNRDVRVGAIVRKKKTKKK
jgi:hypothetical protein